MKNQELKKIGTVSGYYAKIGVAAIDLDGELKKGDEVQIKGGATDFKQKIESMQLNKKDIEKAKKGQCIGIKVNDRVRENDVVYKLL